MRQKEVTCMHALVTVGITGLALFASVTQFDASPHVAMLIGCVAAGAMAALTGYSWEDIKAGMLEGITSSLESVLILLLIGVLIGVWIAAGVVPSMIYYGLKLLSPEYFLAAAMGICSLVSMAAGSWGTVGTVSLALMGVSQAMGLPPGLAAGAIISGSYVGDKLSPLSDSTNLASAVTGVDIFQNVKAMAPVAGTAYVLALLLYGIVGLKFQTSPGSDAFFGISSLARALDTAFFISPACFLPLLLLILGVLFKLPSIPAILLGIGGGAAWGLFFQDVPLRELFLCGYSGYLAQSGNPLFDALMTAGGLEAMMYSVSMILLAMTFGGIMEKTGQMQALMRQVMRLVHSRATLVFITILCCILVNLLLPEQYISIALTGKMFQREYQRLDVKPTWLTIALGAGGTATSVLVPWNTCGIYVTGILGVPTGTYASHTYFNLLMPLAAILLCSLGPHMFPAAKAKKRP